MNRRRFIFSTIAIVATPTFVMGEEATRAVSANKVFASLLDYYRLAESERSRFRPVYRLRAKDGEAGPISLQTGAVRRNLDLAPDGRVMEPPTQQELEQDAQVIVTGLGRMSSDLKLEPILTLGTTIAATDILAAMDQGNHAISQFAGSLSLFAPKIRGVGFTAAESAAGAALLASGQQKSLLYRKGTFEFRPADMRDVSQLVFGAAPSLAEFLD